MLSADIGDEEESVELLRDIVELWLTIRGFSIAGQWMEIHLRLQRKANLFAKLLNRALVMLMNNYHIIITVCIIYNIYIYAMYNY